MNNDERAEKDGERQTDKRRRQPQNQKRYTELQRLSETDRDILREFDTQPHQ